MSEPNTTMERIAALEADRDAAKAHMAAQDQAIEALRSEIGGLRELIRRRLPETERQFAQRLKVEGEAR